MNSVNHFVKDKAGTQGCILPSQGPEHASFIGSQRLPHPESSFGLDTGRETLSLSLGSSGPGWRQGRWAGKQKEAGGECGEGGRMWAVGMA